MSGSFARVVTPSFPSGPWIPRSEAPLHLRRADLPTPIRQGAALSVLDITECYGATSGGIRTYLHEKGTYVSERSPLRQVMVVPGIRDQIEDLTGIRRYHLRGPRVPHLAPYRLMLSGTKVERIIAHERPDVIEVGSAFVVPWLIRQATQRLDIPLVYFHHTHVPGLLGAPTNPASGGHRLLQSLAWRYQRRLDELFPTTIVPSESAARDLRAQGIARIHHVPLGVDLNLFTPARRAYQVATRMRADLPDVPLVGFIGRFSSEKGLPLVFDAWREVERRTGARLVLIGAGPLASQLHRHAYADRVLFRPFEANRSKLADLYAALDVCIAPGPFETFGLAALEALASGTPVLAPTSGAGAELITRSTGGRLFQSGDVSSLVEAAVSLLQDDLQAIGRRGRRYAEHFHGWTQTFDRLFAVYRQVITS